MLLILDQWALAPSVRVGAVCILIGLCGCGSPWSAHGIPNFAQVEPGVWRGGQPNAAGWAFLRSHGVRRDVKLNRARGAPDPGARGHGIQVIYLPITLVQETIGEPSAVSVQAAVEAIRPGTFIHCQHGQDRTGLVIGAYRVEREHWNKAAAYREMRLHGFHPWLRGLYWSWQQDVP